MIATTPRLGRHLLLFLLAWACCAGATAAPADWEHQLPRDAVLMLGEVHDNASQHRLRLEMLQRAFAAGWRPAIAMEQFDRERQPDLDRARRERPTDAQHIIEAATAGDRGGAWNWEFYRPYVALALQYGVPLLAANLSNAETGKIVRDGHAAVFDETTLAALGLARPPDAAWQAAQEREIDAGHCNALPPSLWPKMARAQFARDAVMADVLRQHAGGVVLLAGNGHVRRDIGVPRWLGGAWQGRVFTVGYVEGDDAMPAAAFDVVVHTAPTQRADPCAGFKNAAPRS